MSAVTATGRTRVWSGSAWLTGRWLRRRWLAVLPLLLVVLVGTTGTMLALGSAQRTSEAFDQYLERANVGDVVVNPSVSSTDVDSIIRSLPGVTAITTDSLFMVTQDDGEPRPRASVDDGGIEAGATAGVFGSHDGRYTDMDRPIVQAGRLPTGPSEAALSATAAEAEGLELGDVVPLAFWRLGRPEDEISPATAAQYGDEVISPVGVEHVELVGLITLPDEVLPNELHPRQRAIVSPDIARRYDCLPPPPDPSLSLAENLERNQPPGCAVSYRYYSLSFVDGPAGVKPALEEFVRRVRPLNEELATITDTTGQGADGPQYFLVATETEPERRRVERAIRPTVTALGVLAAAVVAVTIALAGFAAAREVRQTAAPQRQWRQLGMTRAARSAVSASPPLLAIGLGVAGAVVATALIGTTPVGVVRALEPQRSAGFIGANLLAAVLIVLGSAVVTLVLVTRATRPGADGALARNRPTARRLGTGHGPPAVADGIRAAYGPRTALPVIAGSALVSTALVAAVVFGSSLTRLVETPRSYGWSWDLSAMTGGGYGDLDVDGARAALDDDPAVATWTAFGFLNELSLDGDPTMAMIGVERVTPEVDLPLLEGRLPRRFDEVALGPATAEGRGLDVGDRVSIGGGFEAFVATVTGLVVFPTIGPMFADTVGGGNGMLVPQTMIDAIAPVPDAAVELATFVGVELADDADAAAEVRIQERLEELDIFGYPPLIFNGAVRPPEIIEAAATRSIPVVVAASLAVVGALALGIIMWGSVRSRRHDLAVLRALGFCPRQVRWSVRIQSLAITVTALVIGVPFGVIAGRLLWRTFAAQLGVVPDPSSAPATIAALVTVALLLTLVAAEVPARRATIGRPASDLRTE